MLMEIFMKVIGKIINLMDMEFIYIKMELNMMDSGMKIYNMVMVNSFYNIIYYYVIFYLKYILL